MCLEQICPANATYIPVAKITGHALMGKCANIYAIYELNGINHVTRSTVQTLMMMAMMSQPDYIY